MTATDPARSDAAARLQRRLGYTFNDPELLALALTHRSWCAEHAGYISNERLEFLGDAVLGMVVTDHAYRAYPEMPEGELAKLRAAVVNAVVLAEVAVELELGAALRLGKGENANGGRSKQSILADAMEAVIGALYLDGGYRSARDLVLRLLEERIVEASLGPGGQDYKTQLQELAARRFEQLPTYDVRAEGPDHQKRFFATVSVGGEVRAEGEGRSKKQAEQAAARAAWRRLTIEAPDDCPGRVGTGENTHA